MLRDEDFIPFGARDYRIDYRRSFRSLGTTSGNIVIAEESAIDFSRSRIECIFLIYRSNRRALRSSYVRTYINRLRRKLIN